MLPGAAPAPDVPEASRRAAEPPFVGALGRVLLVLGGGALTVAVLATPAAAHAAALQSWSPFVLVAALLGLGAVAHTDGLFDAAAERLARRLGPGGDTFPPRRRSIVPLVSQLGLVAVVTAVLNLDTAVAFVTPVVVLAARHQGADERYVLYGTFFMANAASLLLPGSNLTNLLVVSAAPVSGLDFARHMAPPWIAAVVVTGVVVALWPHPPGSEVDGGAETKPGATSPSAMPPEPPPTAPAPGVPTGSDRRRTPARAATAAAVAMTAALIVAMPHPAFPVLAVATPTVIGAVRRGALDARAVMRAVDPAVLAGLFSLAVALGTLARTWEGPARMLAGAGTVETAAIGAAAAVAFNNLPATVLLASSEPAHPWALLVGLDLGPNLAVTGSLCAVLWFSAARSVGCRPSVAQVSRMGVVAAPLGMGAALAALALTGGG